MSFVYMIPGALFVHICRTSKICSLEDVFYKDFEHLISNGLI